MSVWPKKLEVAKDHIETRSGLRRKPLVWNSRTQIATLPDGTAAPYNEIEIEWLSTGFHPHPGLAQLGFGSAGLGRFLHRIVFGTPIVLRIAGGPQRVFYKGRRAEEIVDLLKTSGVQHTREPTRRINPPVENNPVWDERFDWEESAVHLAVPPLFVFADELLSFDSAELLLRHVEPFDVEEVSAVFDSTGQPFVLKSAEVLKTRWTVRGGRTWLETDQTDDLGRSLETRLREYTQQRGPERFGQTKESVAAATLDDLIAIVRPYTNTR